jgi:hypothetical protein
VGAALGLNVNRNLGEKKKKKKNGDLHHPPGFAARVYALRGVCRFVVGLDGAAVSCGVGYGGGGGGWERDGDRPFHRGSQTFPFQTVFIEAFSLSDGSFLCTCDRGLPECMGIISAWECDHVIWEIVWKRGCWMG